MLNCVVNKFHFSLCRWLCFVVSNIRPKVSKSVHFCEATNTFSQHDYHDATSLTGFPTSTVYPTKDIDGNVLTTEFGLSRYTDHQTMCIQEMPERAPAGLLPSSVDVILSEDLTDAAKPGDRIMVIGIYKPMPQNAASGFFKAVIIAIIINYLLFNVNRL